MMMEWDTFGEMKVEEKGDEKREICVKSTRNRQARENANCSSAPKKEGMALWMEDNITWSSYNRRFFSRPMCVWSGLSHYSNLSD